MRSNLQEDWNRNADAGWVPFTRYEFVSARMRILGVCRGLDRGDGRVERALAPLTGIKNMHLSHLTNHRIIIQIDNH